MSIYFTAPRNKEGGRLKRFALVISLVSLVLLVLSTFVCGAMGAIGEGILYVYTDAGYTTLAPTDSHGFYLVGPGQTVYIQIVGITEFSLGAGVLVKISYDGYVRSWTKTVKTLTSGQLGNGVGDASDSIIWTVGEFDGGVYVEIPFCTTLTVHYKNSSGTGPDYVSSGIISTIGHIHVVPETSLGTIGSLLGLFAALGVFVLTKQRKLSIPRIRKPR
jgi:hypothetical protein